MSINKPTTEADIYPPFEKIGDEGWDSKLRDFLTSFEVPLPQPVSAQEIDYRESALSLSLPAPIRTFLMEFGPVSFDYVEVLPIPQISKASELWFAEQLEANLDNYIIVANAGGTDDHFLIDLESGKCLLTRHYPAEIQPCLASFSDLIRIACVELYTGYYGWDDPELYEMCTNVMEKLFGYSL
ncbi:MAG: SMI1/KNR4 family protein [Planctomycetaceae bacterium]